MLSSSAPAYISTFESLYPAMDDRYLSDIRHFENASPMLSSLPSLSSGSRTTVPSSGDELYSTGSHQTGRDYFELPLFDDLSPSPQYAFPATAQIQSAVDQADTVPAWWPFRSVKLRSDDDGVELQRLLEILAEEAGQRSAKEYAGLHN